MIKELFYSTLNDEIYDTRTEAEKAEDQYVEDYFKELDRRSNAKRRIRQSFVDGSRAFKIPIS